MRETLRDGQYRQKREKCDDSLAFALIFMLRDCSKKSSSGLFLAIWALNAST